MKSIIFKYINHRKKTYRKYYLIIQEKETDNVKLFF